VTHACHVDDEHDLNSPGLLEIFSAGVAGLEWDLQDRAPLCSRAPFQAVVSKRGESMCFLVLPTQQIGCDLHARRKQFYLIHYKWGMLRHSPHCIVGWGCYETVPTPVQGMVKVTVKPIGENRIHSGAAPFPVTALLKLAMYVALSPMLLHASTRCCCC